MSWQSETAGMFDLRHPRGVWNKLLLHHLIYLATSTIPNPPRSIAGIVNILHPD